MLTYNPKEILFSIHIPKTAGTSFSKVLYKWFYPGLHAHYIDHKTNKQPRKINPIKKILHNTHIFPLCIHGHFEEEAGVFDCYPAASQFITFVRDPLEMQVSLFYDHKRRASQEGSLYWKGENVQMEFDGDLDRWVEQRPSYMLNFFPWEIGASNFKTVLNTYFVHIGVVEKMNSSLKIMAEKLGKTYVAAQTLNVSKRTDLPSKSAIAKFKERHQLEYMFYNYCLSLNEI